MATYLGNGQYSLLDVMRQSKNPSINYDGLYQDPDRFSEYDNSRDDHTNQADYPITGNIPTSVLARTDARAYNRNEPLPSAYGEPSRYFNNFNPRIGRPEVVSDFEAGEDGPYLGGNYPENPYPDNTELGDMTGLVTNQFYDQMDKVPTITDMIENNQYNVNDSAMQVMNNAFNQRQIMADETSVGNYPTEPATVPKEAIYQDRIMNNNLPSYGYEPSTRFRDAPNMAEYLQGNPQIMDNIQNTIGTGVDKFKSGLDSLRDFLPFGDKSLSGMAVKGIKGLFEKLGNGADYQQYTPGVDYNGLNDSMINDFYDPRTKTNRFQRAKPGSFASFRTGADYFKARREKKAEKAALASQLQKAQQEIAAKGYKDYGQGAADGSGGYNQGDGGSYSGSSTQDYGGGEKDGGIIGYRNGGLASMFTRRR